MAAYLLIAVVAGFTSVAMLFAGSLGLMLGMVCFVISPLPLFLVGLSQGATAALIAGGVGAVAGALFNVGFGVNYLAFYMVPITILCRQALLWRHDANGDQVWYPLGRLAAILAGLAAIYTSAIFAGAALFADGVVTELERTLSVSARLMGVPDDQVGSFAALAPQVPMNVAVLAMLLLTFNGALAQGLLARFGRNIRPAADIAGLHPPAIMLAALAIALAACLLPDTAGILGKTLAAIVAVTYFLAGLGVIHAWVRNWSARGIVLPLTYVAAFLLIWPAIIGVGLWSQIQRLRRGGADRSEE